MKWDELSFVGGGLSPRRPTAGHVIQLWRVTAGNAPAAGRLEHSNILGGRGAENGLPTANDAEVQAVSHFCRPASWWTSSAVMSNEWIWTALSPGNFATKSL